MGDQRGPITGQVMLGRGRQRLLLEFKGTITAQEREQFLLQVKQLADQNGLTLRKFDLKQIMGEGWGPLLEPPGPHEEE